MTLPPYQTVATQASLDACVECCRRAPAVAVDTEFMRTDTFFPILGLIQISDGEEVWLIDPLAIEDFSSLDALFNDPAVTKVFHSCSEDLEVLRHQLGLVPTPVFDTQTAAAFLGFGFSRGYVALVEQVLGIKLEQHETRSDWLQRPLSPSQCHYASEDVYYLMLVHRVLAGKLAAEGRRDWMAEEMASLVAAARIPETPDSYYLRIKGAWKLAESELARLRDLARWREEEARTRNRPRNRVISDQLLLDLVRLRPQNREQLQEVKGLHPGQLRRYGKFLVEQLRGEPEPAELETLPPPLDRVERELLSQCRDLVNGRAEALGMAVELMARKKDLEQIVRSRDSGAVALPERLASGWRYATIGRELHDHVAKTAV